MGSPTEYTVITNWHRDSFLTAVEELLKKGWELSGGVSVSVDKEDDLIYTQAMVKRHDT